jgi:hypothetical protein
MSREEKVLLLELILRDIRGNWGWDLHDRVDEAEALATELELAEHLKSIATFREHISEGDHDGRHFRRSHLYGGYEGMEQLHGLPHLLADRSEEFKDAALGILTYPDCAFEDFTGE